MFVLLYSLLFFMIFFISILFFFFSLNFLFFDLVYFIEWEIINLNSSSIIMVFLFDWMSFLFMSFVLFISSLVIYYSKEYMSGDLNGNRFIILIFLFILSMMMLIISPNLISILLGWDGLGLISYCLVIYFQNVKSYNAGMLTVLSNRLGDVALLLAIAWMLNYGSWSFYMYLDSMKTDSEMFIIGSLVMLAAMTKSAQIPFSAWLPAAMAAPTPVSALVHSSTLVTAGVYLMIRFNYLLNNSFMFYFLLLIGSMTMFMSGVGANFEMDLKKIIALSTLSQLGLMMGILSLGLYKLAFFHLLTHALFKALLFLCAGVLIHSMMNFQDIRMSGGFIKQMPLTLMCFNISSLALCGMPFLAGFYSKDLILEMVLLSNINFLIFFFFFFSTGLTVSYSFRLIYFSSCMNMNGFSLLNLKDEGWAMLKMMFILSFMSIIGGSMLSWLIFSFSNMILLPSFLKLLTIFVCILGGLLGYFLFSLLKIYYLFYNNIKNLLYFFFSLMWFMPSLFTYKLNYFFLKIGLNYFKSFDTGWNEMMSGYFMFNYIKGKSMNLIDLYTNYLKNYFYSLMLFLFFFIFVYFFY